MAALRVLAFSLFLSFTLLTPPAFSQMGTNEMNDYSLPGGLGLDSFSQEAWGRTSLDSTLRYLERKAEEARERREREERKRRRSELDITNTPEQLFGYTPSRQFPPSSSRRYRP